MEIYRIKHKKTGLYFMPSRDGMNLSKTGKIYDLNHGWLHFIKTRSIAVNRCTKIGKQIADGEIKLGEICWPKDSSKWTSGMNYNDLPDKTNATKFHVIINPDEWEKEIVKL